MSLFQWAKSGVIKPPTRNQRYLAAIARNHSRKKDGLPSNPIKKQIAREKRRQELLKDTDRVEFFQWMFAIQGNLKLSDREFAKELGVSHRMVLHYKAKTGYMPSKKIFGKLLELEKRTKIIVRVKKNKTSFVKIQPIHTIVIR